MILKNIKKIWERRVKTKLKHGVVLAINTQEELNLLAEIEDIVEDCLFIDEPYIAFKDELAIQVIPLREVDESYPMEFLKPRKFMPWYRKNKE